VKGGPGNDTLLGGTGGGTGSDHIVGGPGNDFLAGSEVLAGGAGNDVTIVADMPAVKDKVTCSGGYDRVLSDRKDVVAPNCEKVVRNPLAFFEFLESVPASFYEGLGPSIF
jgi:hypothetical protein